MSHFYAEWSRTLETTWNKMRDQRHDPSLEVPWIIWSVQQQCTPWEPPQFLFHHCLTFQTELLKEGEPCWQGKATSLQLYVMSWHSLGCTRLCLSCQRSDLISALATQQKLVWPLSQGFWGFGMGEVSLSAVTENRKEFITQITISVFTKMSQVNIVCDNAHMRCAICVCVWCTLCLC